MTSIPFICLQTIVFILVFLILLRHILQGYEGLLLFLLIYIVELLGILLFILFKQSISECSLFTKKPDLLHKLALSVLFSWKGCVLYVLFTPIDITLPDETIIEQNFHFSFLLHRFLAIFFASIKNDSCFLECISPLCVGIQAHNMGASNISTVVR